MSLKGKVVLITGASSGIGASTAVLFAKNGASLALVGRNLERLHMTEELCHPNEVLIIPADLTCDDDVSRVIQHTIDKFKQLDILVNNAGILETGSIETTSLAQYDRVTNINVRSIYHLTSLAVPHLIKTKGSVVNVSSVCGIRSFENVLAYCMSKSALDQFTRCIALELATKQVRVNAVNPGVITTGLHMRSGNNSMDSERYKKFLEMCKETHALGRPGEPNEVAEAILFLANNSTSSFITGETIAVDGGRHAMCPR